MSLASGVNCAKSGEQQENLFGNGGIFNTIVNVLLFLIGAIIGNASLRWYPIYSF